MIPTSFSLVNSGSNYLFRDDNALADGNTAIPIDHRNPTATTTTTTGTIIPPSNIHTTADEEELSRIFSLLFSEDDILYCPELGPSILRTWKEREIHNYRNIHGDRISRTQVSTGIRSHMRAQLVDWLIDVSNDFLVTLESGISSKMSIESVYKAIYMIDYMLSYRPIPIDQLQLLGATALFTATTLEEIIATFQPMDVSIFVPIHWIPVQDRMNGGAVQELPSYNFCFFISSSHPCFNSFFTLYICVKSMRIGGNIFGKFVHNE